MGNKKYNNENEKSSSNTNNSYYDQGSAKPKQVTSATVRRLAERNHLTVNANRLLLVLVGLPGRGKSFISRKLQAYFSWQCVPCKIFNVGKYRRKASNAETHADASFFDSKNEKAQKLRNEIAMIALDDALDWLDSREEAIRLGGKVSSIKNLSSSGSSTNSDSGSWNEYGVKSKIAIYDATNSTKSRREAIIQKCTAYEQDYGKPIGIVFIESICDDEELLEENFRMKVSVSPDYASMSIEDALVDVKERVRKYEEQYETIQDDSLSYIKIFNLSSKLLANLVYGRMSKAVVPALMAWHIGNRPIFLCRSGKTEDVSTNSNEKKLIRNGRLDNQGLEFRDELSSFFYSEAMEFLSQQGSQNPHFVTGTSMCGGRKSVIDAFDKNCPGKIMSSTMPRSLETAYWEDFTLPIDILSNLNPLDKGDFTGRELEEIKDLDPVWYSMLEQDPYNTRFPGGECYHDLINRLESCVIDMEQQVVPVLVVSHVSVIQVLLSYFCNTPIEKCTSIEIPMHTVIKLVPADGGGWTETRIQLMKNNMNEETISPIANKKAPIWTDFSSSSKGL